MLQPMRTKSGCRAPLWCAQPGLTKETQDMNNFFNDLQGKINQALESGPAKDIERNVKAVMTQGFAKLDLVTREEFDIQAQVLAKTRAKLEALEQRVIELEARLATQSTASAATAAQAETPHIITPPNLDKQ